MWFTKKIEEIFTSTNSSSQGLSTTQVKENQSKYGSNVLEKEKKDSIFKIVLNNILEPLTIILIVVIVICFFIKEYKEVIIISIIILINVIISTVQELKSQAALDALEKMTSAKSTVIRDGKTMEIDSTELVVGDIILLEAGNFIPADIRLIEAAKLYVDESALTGESIVAEKNTVLIDNEKTPLGDRLNMVFSSTFITNGRAQGVVVAVGKDTEIGKIAGLISAAPKMQTPLQERLAQLSKYVAIFAFVIAGVILAINLLVNGQELGEAFITAITLAVAVIPESLPVIVSIILAISVSRMAAQNAIIKKLPAVESLGTVNIICTDKTGTLTLNKMSVVETFVGTEDISSVTLEVTNPLVKAMALCNDSFVDANGNPIGDPTELALTYFVDDLGIDVLKYRQENPRTNELPFDSDRKLMSTVHKDENNEISYTKGAIDQLLARTKYILDKGIVREITKEDTDLIMKHSNDLSLQALRVLAFGYSSITCDDDVCEENIVFIGAVGLIDPEKEEAKIAIASAKAAGIKTIMITGDHPATALAIAKKLNLTDDEKTVITGLELDEISDEELAKIANNYFVYSRVSPEHKVRIVKALQAQGNVVSMTGDGVNDAPSLQTAHIGVAMGVTGTDVAKQASSMILMDDNFATIVYAVEEGRNIYNKIKKAVQFVLATNLGEVTAIFIAVLIGVGEPLSAIHVLWVNLIVESLIAIPIGMDVNDPGVMNEKPRPKSENIFTGAIVSTLFLSLVIVIALLGSYLLSLNLGYEKEIASSVAFFVMSTAPMLYILAIRKPHVMLIKSKPWENKYLSGAIILGIVLNLILIYTPLNNFFDLTALTGTPLLIAIVGIIFPTFCTEVFKFLFRK